MNRTQKNAWFGLVNCLLAIGFTIFLYYRIVFWIPVPGFKFAPEPSQTQIIFQAIGNFWPLVMPVIAVILLLIPRTKQSPAEPDFDELDADIQNKAIRRSFFLRLVPLAHGLDADSTEERKHWNFVCVGRSVYTFSDISCLHDDLFFNNSDFVSQANRRRCGMNRLQKMVVMVILYGKDKKATEGKTL